MIGIHVDHFYAFWLKMPLSNNNREHFLYYIGNDYEKNFKFW